MVSWRRSLLIVVVGLVLGVLLLAEALKPVRRELSARYVERGNSYLKNEEFEDAASEYAKALKLEDSNPEALKNSRLALQGKTDVAALRPFFVEEGITSAVQDIDRATKPYSDPKEALAVGMAFYSKGDYSYAQYPLRSAVALNPGYSEAWHYLALTYDELARIDNSYLQKAEDARGARDLITPKYLDL